MWPSTCRSTAIRDRRPISAGLSHRSRQGRLSRVAAAEGEPRYGVNVRAKRREGFARVSHNHPDCPTAPVERAQFFNHAPAGASGDARERSESPWASSYEPYERPALRNCFANFPAEPNVATASFAVMATVVSMLARLPPAAAARIA